MCMCDVSFCTCMHNNWFCVYKYMSVHMYTQIFVPGCLCICNHIYVDMSICAHGMYSYIPTHTPVYTLSHTHKHVFTHTKSHTYMHAHTHTQIYMHRPKMKKRRAWAQKFTPKGMRRSLKIRNGSLRCSHPYRYVTRMHVCFCMCYVYVYLYERTCMYMHYMNIMYVCIHTHVNSQMVFSCVHKLIQRLQVDIHTYIHT